MLTLSKGIKNQNSPRTVSKRVSVRDQLLTSEVIEMKENLPKTCKVQFDDSNKLHLFTLSINPEEGFWQGGVYKFHIEVPEDYNIMPPKVHCSTRIWHPNINENGEVCLSLLREQSFDGMGWAPTRRLKEVIWGLSSLFSDLLNFDDPLNVEAAEMYEKDKGAFISKVKDYVKRYASR